MGEVLSNELRPPERDDWQAALLRIGLFTIVLFGSAVLLFGLEIPTGWLLWGIITVISLGWLIRWHTRSFGYSCPKCSHAFTITPLTNMISPNILGTGGPRKYLRCPNCGQRSWCPVQVLIEHP